MSNYEERFRSTDTTYRLRVDVDSLDIAMLPQRCAREIDKLLQYVNWMNNAKRPLERLIISRKSMEELQEWLETKAKQRGKFNGNVGPRTKFYFFKIPLETLDE